MCSFLLWKAISVGQTITEEEKKKTMQKTRKSFKVDPKKQLELLELGNQQQIFLSLNTVDSLYFFKSLSHFSFSSFDSFVHKIFQKLLNLEPAYLPPINAEGKFFLELQVQVD